MPHRLLGAEEGPPQVHREHLVEVGHRELVAVRGDLDAGVVDQVVDSPVLLDNPLEHPRDLGLVGDVGLDQGRVGAALAHPLHADVDAVLNGLLGLLGALDRPHIVDGDIDALLAEPDRDRLPDPGAAAGDDGDLALEPLHHALLCRAP